jgi:hypothetical protein
MPELLHVSPCIAAVQSTHARPIVPQLVGESGMHVVPEQQPLGHDIGSQTQCPPMQRWPAVHAAPPPHVQAPPVHASAPVPHATHEAPTLPHAMRVAGETQVEPEQQPPGHVLDVQLAHTPPLQLPAPQLVHAAPPVPHASAVSPDTHVVP